MRYTLDAETCRNYAKSSRIEWILPNGLGGFAMGTVSGANTRRYHAHLLAATVPPVTRMMLLANVEAAITLGGRAYGLSTNQYVGAIYPTGHSFLESFSLADFAEWNYVVMDAKVRKRLGVHKGKNACTVEFTNTGRVPFDLQLRPLVAHSFYHGDFRYHEDYPDEILHLEGETRIRRGGLTLFLGHKGALRSPVAGWYYRFELPREAERGLSSHQDLFCPAELAYSLQPGESALLVASAGEAEWPRTFPRLGPSRTSLEDKLRAAAGLFLVETPSRSSIVAGYPWFIDWGRDTMISLPGVCLHTGRVDAARRILASYATQLHMGLIPNRFGELGETPDYNTVDATLWFANAIYATLQVEWDPAFGFEAFRWLREIFTWHLEGTLFGIKVDPEDGLLRQGEPGVQLTWMDAKIGDWVVTPRHGKPVEVQGLWINLLRVLEWLAESLKEDPTPYRDAALKAEAAFDRTFWRESLGYFLDTADPDDGSLRPNQLIAMSLPFGPAKGAHAASALGHITEALLTPRGLRTLAPADAKYRPRYEGDMASRDSAYHQGTVWPWLLGPYATALVRHTGDRAGARKALRRAAEAMLDYGLGGISEVCDGDAPHRPGGCPWQAWSAAEILRAWVEDCGENS